MGEQSLCPRCRLQPSAANHTYCRSCANAYMRDWRKAHPLRPEQRERENTRRRASTRGARELRQTAEYVEGVLSREPFDETQRAFAAGLLRAALSEDEPR